MFWRGGRRGRVRVEAGRRRGPDRVRGAGFKILRPIPETHPDGKAYAFLPVPFSRPPTPIVVLSSFTNVWDVDNGTECARWAYTRPARYV